MTYLRQVLFVSFLSLQSFFVVFASEEAIQTPQSNSRELIESFLGKSLSIEEELKVILDGSPKASDLERKSTTQNRLVYIDSDHWRALRSRPLQRDSKEYLKADGHLYEMSSGNQRNRITTKLTDSFWIEIIAAPVHYAREWSLCESNDSLKDLLSKLKSAEGHSLKNADGDQITAEFKDDGSVLISSKGKILQDAKTQVQVESIWRMAQIGTTSSENLEKSLLRSHEQK